MCVCVSTLTAASTLYVKDIHKLQSWPKERWKNSFTSFFLSVAWFSCLSFPPLLKKKLAQSHKLHHLPSSFPEHGMSLQDYGFCFLCTNAHEQHPASLKWNKCWHQKFNHFQGFHVHVSMQEHSYQCQGFFFFYFSFFSLLCHFLLTLEFIWFTFPCLLSASKFCYRNNLLFVEMFLFFNCRYWCICSENQ